MSSEENETVYIYLSLKIKLYNSIRSLPYHPLLTYTIFLKYKLQKEMLKLFLARNRV